MISTRGWPLKLPESSSAIDRISLRRASPKYRRLPPAPLNTPNPIAWRFAPGDTGVGIDPTGSEYQVKLGSASTWPSTWTAAAETAAGSGVFAANIYRSDVPAVGTDEAVFQIRFRGHDRFGRETGIQTRCWGNHPLAAPLDLSAGALPTSASDTGLNPLTSTILPSDDTGMLALLNSTASGYAMIKVPINNGTPENVYLRLGVDSAGMAGAK